jgi:quercetin dioxygenase-like cupin family protein
MKGSGFLSAASCALAVLAIGCASQPAQPAEPPAATSEQQTATGPGAAGSNRQAEFGRFPDREFIRLRLDQFQWRATEGNTLGVQTAVLEGDPSKPGFYLTINRFPPGVMSRPHYHPDERNITVIKGTWYTDEGTEFRPDKAIPMKPGEYMRHPAGGPHYDGALDEEVWVAISGYGPTSATILDGGELFGRSRPAPGTK